MPKESGKNKHPLDQTFTSAKKQQQTNARALRALNKSQKLSDRDGGVEPSSREQHEQAADALMELGQNELIGPRIASGGGGGGGVGGGGVSLPFSDDMSPEVASAMEIEATAQDQVAKEGKQRQKRLRQEQREAENRTGIEDHVKLQETMPNGIPQGLLTGERLGYGVTHLIAMNFKVESVQSPTYKCNVPESWNWVVQNYLGDDYTNGVGLHFASIQPQHAVVMLNPLTGVWCIGPASDDDKCTVTVNGNVVPFDKPEVIVDGNDIVLGTIPMVFTTTLGKKK